MHHDSSCLLEDQSTYEIKSKRLTKEVGAGFPVILLDVLHGLLEGKESTARAHSLYFRLCHGDGQPVPTFLV